MGFVLSDEEIASAIEGWEKDLLEANKVALSLKGNLVQHESNLPQYCGQYGDIHSDIKYVRKLAENHLEYVEGTQYKAIRKQNHSLSPTDIKGYLNASETVLEARNLVAKLKHWDNKYDELMKSLDKKHWQLSNLTKLYVGGLEDVEIIEDLVREK